MVVLLPLMSMRKMMHLHSIRCADWHRIMANWVLVVGIHGWSMGLWHGLRGRNIGQRLGKRDRVAMVVRVIAHVQHRQLLLLVLVLGVM